MNPRGKCTGLQAPCGRSCYGSSSSCGYVPDSCSSDLSWAANTGTKSYSWWYPDFESITGVSLSAAREDDVQLYWFCDNQNPNGNCGGLEAPCGRSCGNGAFTDTKDENESGNSVVDYLVWILIGSAMAIGIIFFVAMIVCIRRKRSKAIMVGDDDVTLQDDQQLHKWMDR